MEPPQSAGSWLRERDSPPLGRRLDGFAITAAHLRQSAGATRPAPSGIVRLGRVRPGQQRLGRLLVQGWCRLIRLGADQLGRTTAESRPRRYRDGHARPWGQRRSASRTLPRRGRPPPAAPDKRAPPATALLGGALAGSGPGTSPCIDGLSLVTDMVVPQRLTCSNHAHDDGRPYPARLRRDPRPPMRCCAAP
jgi:hypothetical protein